MGPYFSVLLTSFPITSTLVLCKYFHLRASTDIEYEDIVMAQVET